MKKILNFVFAAIVAVLVAACGHSDEINGYVVGKHHYPARVERVMRPLPGHPETKVYPERWVVMVADSVRVHRVHVSRETFNGMRKGEFVRLKP